MFPDDNDTTQPELEPVFEVAPVADEPVLPVAADEPAETPVADEPAAAPAAESYPVYQVAPAAQAAEVDDAIPAYEVAPAATFDAGVEVDVEPEPEPDLFEVEPEPFAAPVLQVVEAPAADEPVDPVAGEDMSDDAPAEPAKRSRRGLSVPKLRRPARRARGGRSNKNAVCGLHLEQGEVVAAVATAEGGLTVVRAAAADLPYGAVREGEVIDAEALGAALKRMFSEHGLPKRVRVGIANQRTIMRTIDLPPLEREQEIAAAVRMHAPEHIAMPLDQAVMDFQVLGRVDTPEGPRTRVVVVATDRESVERLLDALRRAGLRPEGVDLSAFALIRALHQRAVDADGPVLYAHVGGTTTLAIADGTDCRFTRVSSSGFDLFAGQLAEREEIPLDEARHRLAEAGSETGEETEGEDFAARSVLEAGTAQLGDDLRTSIEFYASQWGGSVSEVVLTGTAVGVAGFVDALERRTGLPVRAGAVEAGAEALGGLEPWRVAVAAGLSVSEVAA